MKCENADEDPLDSCLPVNCHIKYSGNRGFYSTLKKRCMPIPMCQSNNNQTKVNNLLLHLQNQNIVLLILKKHIRPIEF